MITLFLILSGCGTSSVQKMDRYGNEIGEFSVINQKNESFEKADLDGKVWLVNFIFTNCSTVCPPMTMNMKEVITELEEKDVDNYGVISFSVDPEVDTPEVLNDFINQYNIPSNIEWHLLTGYDIDYIQDFAKEHFKTMVAPPPKGSNQATHGTSTYLIDDEGIIIRDYSGVDNSDTAFQPDEIVSDVETLSGK